MSQQDDQGTGVKLPLRSPVVIISGAGGASRTRRSKAKQGYKRHVEYDGQNRVVVTDYCAGDEGSKKIVRSGSANSAKTHDAGSSPQLNSECQIPACSPESSGAAGTETECQLQKAPQVPSLRNTFFFRDQRQSLCMPIFSTVDSTSDGKPGESTSQPSFSGYVPGHLTAGCAPGAAFEHSEASAAPTVYYGDPLSDEDPTTLHEKSFIRQNIAASSSALSADIENNEDRYASNMDTGEVQDYSRDKKITNIRLGASSRSRSPRSNLSTSIDDLSPIPVTSSFRNSVLRTRVPQLSKAQPSGPQRYALDDETLNCTFTPSVNTSNNYFAPFLERQEAWMARSGHKKSKLREKREQEDIAAKSASMMLIPGVFRVCMIVTSICLDGG